MAGFRLPVLGYHYVGDADPGILPQLRVPTAEFVQQLDWLRAWGYTTVSPQALIAARNGSAALPHRPVLITFDDGYAELCRTAFPALRNRGMSAIVFVVTRRLGDVNTWDADESGHPVDLLTEGDIGTWRAARIEFGAHTRTHRNLVGATDAALDDEIAGSRSDLEAILGKNVETFAYPYGATDTRAELAAAKAFPLAFCTWHGVNGLHTDRAMLRRTMITAGQSAPGFRSHLLLGRNLWESMKGFRQSRLMRRLRPRIE